MPPELSLLIGSIVGGTGALLSYWAGWRARGDVMRIRGGANGRQQRNDWGTDDRFRGPDQEAFRKDDGEVGE